MPKSLQELYKELLRESGAAGEARLVDSLGEQFMGRLTQLLLSWGVQAHATDIHVEPGLSGVRIRYRIDGILYEMLHLPSEISDQLIRSMKAKAKMTTEMKELGRPQDSRFIFKSEDEKVEMRLSSFPTVRGDLLAFRLFNRTSIPLEFHQLGFSDHLRNEFESLLRLPYGFILVVGPTGSGKTTTLHTALVTLRSPQLKIVTLEDPVEYELDGVSHTQINPASNLTFASGLRALLRQDVDVILIGEMRDTETSEIAIRAALAGHLVFSTFHARHAFGALHRFLDMGIEPHLVSAALSGVLSQRLARLICPHCKVPDPHAAESFKRIWAQKTSASPPPDLNLTRLSKGTGCPSCASTGYQGRTGLFELVTLTNEIKAWILDRFSGDLRKIARDLGVRTFLIDGLEKAAQGLTTIEEVLRVTGETEE